MTPSSREVWLPLFFYLVVTLGVPLSPGGHARPGFSAHAATLLLAVAAFAALRLGLRRLRPTSEDM